MALTVGDKTFDSGKCELRFNSTAAPVEKVSFGDKLNKEFTRRIGSQEIAAVTDGEYETEDISITIEQAVWIGILDKLPDGYGNVQMALALSAHDDAIGTLSVNAMKCTICGVKDSIEAGPGALKAELTIKTQQIVRNGKTINRRVGANNSATMQI